MSPPNWRKPPTEPRRTPAECSPFVDKLFPGKSANLGPAPDRRKRDRWSGNGLCGPVRESRYRPRSSLVRLVRRWAKHASFHEAARLLPRIGRPDFTAGSDRIRRSSDNDTEVARGNLSKPAESTDTGQRLPQVAPMSGGRRESSR
ncbi:hypothetical protein BIW11_04666 [Tropilaelaps mercedesae]|uniref:Uncharacterized protein n=1 Tax=Tropilaelaps mercedesae TaxID=418985 RepID=A0A1V9X3E1_9ACAR|nr:hypothetical protein BIW11_04666 [Tropilaelaps mercedesae]